MVLLAAERDKILEDWLGEVLGTHVFQLSPLAGDASFRKYYRTHCLRQNIKPSLCKNLQGCDQTTFVVMDAPPPESPQTFMKVAEILQSSGVSVPNILEANLEQGFLLLSDFGNQLYLHALNDATKDSLYEDAFRTLLEIQQCKAKLPIFTPSLLKKELEELFKGWYLKTHIKIDQSKDFEWSEKMVEKLDNVLENIIEVVEAQPKVFIHRDYHSRNLMVIPENNPGILDFQDALIGPMTYDLVSLLQDCYISWPRPMVEAWVFDFQEKLESKGLLPKVGRALFLRWFDFTGLQRHLKNLGIFSRKYHRDNNASYLRDIPMPFKYIQEACERYPELQFLGELFAKLALVKT